MGTTVRSTGYMVLHRPVEPARFSWKDLAHAELRLGREPSWRWNTHRTHDILALMRAVFTGTVVFAALILSVATTHTMASQASTPQQFFTRQAPWLCVGGGFVAMVPLARPQTLFIIPIDGNGIEALQKIPTTGNEVFGLQCIGSHIELRVREEGSDHFSVLPFSVDGNTIKPEDREDINWSISQKLQCHPRSGAEWTSSTRLGRCPGPECAATGMSQCLG
jgi:hypothetical protein